ncbi:MAG: DUF507 family protein [Acidobacteria bacterium]|nr:MAG: DUF507 family protein [Acidobacteriota bacterium]
MDAGKLSTEKMLHLSHVILKGLQAIQGLTLNQPANDVRNRLLAILRDEMRRDLQIENRARRKITSQRRNIPEGSPEWDILFRKYYEEELSARRRS